MDHDISFSNALLFNKKCKGIVFLIIAVVKIIVKVKRISLKIFNIL